MLSWLSKIEEKAMDYKKKFLRRDNQDTKSDLDKAFREYEDWRKNRPNRGLIPAHLWESAVKLCQTHSINQVVKTLHLNYNALKSRVENNHAGSTYKKGKRNSRKKTARFIDLTTSGVKLPFHSVPSSIIIEYQKTDGNNLKIHIPQSIDLNLPEIIFFLSRERNS
jgi:hypothetical protein